MTGRGLPTALHCRLSPAGPAGTEPASGRASPPARARARAWRAGTRLAAAAGGVLVALALSACAPVAATQPRQPDPTLTDPEPAPVLRPTRPVVWQHGRLAPAASAAVPAGSRGWRLRESPFMIEVPWPSGASPPGNEAALYLCASTDPAVFRGIGDARQLTMTPCFSGTGAMPPVGKAAPGPGPLRVSHAPLLQRLEPRDLTRGPQTWQAFFTGIELVEPVGLVCPANAYRPCTDRIAARPIGSRSVFLALVADFNGNRVADAGEWVSFTLESAQEPGPSTAAAAWGPVLVRVNGHPIHLAEAHLEMSATASAERLDTQPLSNALARLIDLELAQQEALRSGLVLHAAGRPAVDGTPASHRLARARAARALADHLSFHAPRPTEAELRRHHDAWPERYAQRRIVDLDVFDADPASVSPLVFEAAAIGATGAQRLADRLSRAGVPHQRQRRTVAADELPLSDARRLAAALPDQPVALWLDNRPSAAFVRSTAVRPRSFDDSREAIRAELESAATQRLLGARIQRLAATARLEWVAPSE